MAFYPPRARLSICFSEWAQLAGWHSAIDQELITDMSRMINGGFQGVKMKVGQKDPWADLKRVQAVRWALGGQARRAIPSWPASRSISIGRHEARGVRHERRRRQ